MAATSRATASPALAFAGAFAAVSLGATAAGATAGLLDQHDAGGVPGDDTRSFARRAWVLPAALALHVAEEAPRFAAWARRNAWSGYTQRDFVRINGAGLAMTIAGTWLARRTCRRAPFLAWHTAVLSQQTLWNPVFHAGATVAYRRYSPGLATALALLPATWVALTGAAIREGRISRRAAALSALAGAPVHAAAVARQVYGVGAER